VCIARQHVSLPCEKIFGNSTRVVLRSSMNSDDDDDDDDEIYLVDGSRRPEP
jgi:hypothetical protein